MKKHKSKKNNNHPYSKETYSSSYFHKKFGEPVTAWGDFQLERNDEKEKARSSNI